MENESLDGYYLISMEQKLQHYFRHFDRFYLNFTSYIHENQYPITLTYTLQYEYLNLRQKLDNITKNIDLARI